uniref:Urotensin 2B n=1 Tax=Jaculus jaculus TaxID=51337 RepID=A0A8C5K832_JACJA
MKIFTTSLCFGLLTLLSVMILWESVQGWPYITPGKELFPDKEDTHQEELLMALLNKNFDFQRPSNIGVELVNKLEKLNQLQKLKEQITDAKSSGISYAVDNLSSSHGNKRACFWKYCV